MLRKPNKLDYTTVKCYEAISLLNYLKKVYEKVVADMLNDWCKINHVLNVSQMKSKRQRSTIYAAAMVISLMQEA